MHKHAPYSLGLICWMFLVINHIGILPPCFIGCMHSFDLLFTLFGKMCFSFTKYPISVRICPHLLQYLEDPTHDPSLSSSAWTGASFLADSAKTCHSHQSALSLEESSADLKLWSKTKIKLYSKVKVCTCKNKCKQNPKGGKQKLKGRKQKSQSNTNGTVVHKSKDWVFILDINQGSKCSVAPFSSHSENELK